MRLALAVGSTLALAACGGDSTGPGSTPDPGPAPVASVTVTPTMTDFLRPGRTAQLTARALDAAGNVLTGRPITWTSSNPSVVTVSPTGLVSIVDGSGFGGGFIGVTAASGGRSADANVAISAWTFTVTTDAVNGATITEAHRSANNGTLYVRCYAPLYGSPGMDVYVTNLDVTQNGAVEWRVDMGTPQAETWDEATTYRALFAPFGKRHATAHTIASGDTFLFRYNRFTGGTQTVTVDVYKGLATYLPRLEAACPGGG